MFNLLNIMKLLAIFAISLFVTASVYTQTTTFTYQGRLTDSTIPSPTNGTYEMRFRAYDAVSGGNQFPVTVTLPTVQVTNGIFTVQLDFGSAAFNGQTVFIEIGSRPAGNPNPLTVLNPRQQVTSAPYAVQSLNATDSDNLGGIAANQYVLTNDSRLTNARDPLAGSFSYIQNTNSTQSFASFNVAGNGTVGSVLTGYIVNTPNQYNINGNRVLSIGGTNNTFAGINSGNANSGTGNSFFGDSSGQTNTSGSGNAFFGFTAGRDNSNGFLNAFFGSGAGVFNSSGSSNSFFGYAAGEKNAQGTDNSFFGTEAGRANTTSPGNSFFGRSAGKVNTGASNSFFGRSAGGANTTGANNAFFGNGSGAGNTLGNNNTLIGTSADVGANNLNNATAIGANAQVMQSNSIVLGSIDGVNGATADTKVGIGTNTPTAPLTIKTEIFSYGLVHTNGTVTVGEFVDGNGGWVGTKSNHSLNFFVNDGSSRLSINTNGTVSINTLGAAGSTSLCRNSANQISTCTAGNFTEGGTANSAEIAILRSQLALQTEQNKQQQLQIDGLRKIVCSQNSQTEVCKELK